MSEGLSSVEHSVALRDVLSLITRDPYSTSPSPRFSPGRLIQRGHCPPCHVADAGRYFAKRGAGLCALVANLAQAPSPQLAAARGYLAARQLAIGNLAVRAVGCIVALPSLPDVATWLAVVIPSERQRLQPSIPFSILFSHSLSCLCSTRWQGCALSSLRRYQAERGRAALYLALGSGGAGRRRASRRIARDASHGRYDCTHAVDASEGV